ncbi:MAG: hypothetical protein HY584_05840 [Candidatus Omnitrophica bacterium]|nr:hypothetical protein [Candidatus Omnitrophota bacterium]
MIPPPKFGPKDQSASGEYLGGGMIYFVVALPSEAKPLVNRYQLKLISSRTQFKVYGARQVFLIVSGVGKIRVQEAVRFLYEHTGSIRNSVWLNVGIAGHSSYPVGTAVLAHKVADQITQESWYPPILFDVPCQTDSIVTVDRPETEYRDPFVYDMEASGFYKAAIQFSTVELVHCFKVISDNRRSSTKQVSKALTERLIQNRLGTLDSVVKKIEKIAERLPSIQIDETRLKQFLDHWHFTVTQQHQLRRLLARLEILEPKSAIWSSELGALSKSKDVLNFLESRINSLPVGL